jgi:hypothetical protein
LPWPASGQLRCLPPAGYDALDPSVAVLQASADEAIQRAEADAAVSATETRITETERQAQEAIGRTGPSPMAGDAPRQGPRDTRLHGAHARAVAERNR